jgi:hypothetical protein
MEQFKVNEFVLSTTARQGQVQGTTTDGLAQDGKVVVELARAEAKTEQIVGFALCGSQGKA